MYVSVCQNFFILREGGFGHPSSCFNIRTAFAITLYNVDACRPLVLSIAASHKGRALVLGPLLFVLYVADVGRLIDSLGASSHAFAEEKQVNAACPPGETGKLRTRVQDCVLDVAEWMASNRLSLYPSKTKLLWLITPKRGYLIDPTPFDISGKEVASSNGPRLLGYLSTLR